MSDVFFFVVSVRTGVTGGVDILTTMGEHFQKSLHDELDWYTPKKIRDCGLQASWNRSRLLSLHHCIHALSTTRNLKHTVATTTGRVQQERRIHPAWAARSLHAHSSQVH